MKQLLIFRHYANVFVSRFLFENPINIDFSKAITDL